MIPFSKWQGCGNDFVLLVKKDILDAGHPADLSPAWIASVCDRKFGIGSDGLILLEKADRGLNCLMWNPDGSSSGMCGNGIRCAAKHALAQGLWENGSPFWMSNRRIEARVEGEEVLVGMGRPSGDPWDPTRTDLTPFLFQLSVLGEVTAHYGVSFGNPHLVTIVPSLGSVRLHESGPVLEKHPDLPGSANVHFVELHGIGIASALHWERGAGQTLACGSGACAIFTVLRHLGLCQEELQLKVPGGLLALSGDETGVWKKGPARESFSGWLSEGS